VGDYPLDHHHKKSPQPVEETFPEIPAFNVPYGCLVPQSIDGVLVAEKSISVSHLVNGCTRLQPVVMLIGQAAGASAALCVKEKMQPRNIPIRSLQQILLDANCWLMPFLDNTPADWAFQSVQRIGLCGVLKGEPISRDWANEMRFHPDQGLTFEEAHEAIHIAIGERTLPKMEILSVRDVVLSRGEAVRIIWTVLGSPAPQLISNQLLDVSASHPAFPAIQYFYERGWLEHFINAFKFQPDRMMTRKEFAFLIDLTLDPFQNCPLNSNFETQVKYH
jgi:hypothetical protein